MNKYRFPLLILACFIFVALIILYTTKIIVKANSACSQVQLSDKENGVYVEWILNHSRRISKQTATGIYNVAMSMEKGLLLIAIASIESGIDPGAISKKGAMGLNQIMPGVWVKELIKQGIIKEKKDLFNYDKNLLASHYILTKYYKKSGSWRAVLTRYVGKYDKKYANKVFAVYGELLLLTKNNSTTEGDKK